jgi:hypothetical protein
VKVVGGVPMLVHASHVTGVTRSGPSTTGEYIVTFDRHVDNCALSTSVDTYNGSFDYAVIATKNGALSGQSTSAEAVFEKDSASHASVDNDFDIIALCPGT